ncbi:MAG: radical SAM protein, partial [Sulfolobales archaeon]|nr:radical SAM protein [Sulfolobales archaeon]
IVGGLAAMSNPEPFLDIADASFIGDGEVLLQRLVRYFSTLPENPGAFLDSLDSGVYTGEANVRKVVVEDLSNSFHPTVEIRSKKVEPVFGEGFYVEISRGCRWLCKFCLEAYAMYPYRYRSLETVKKLVDEGLRHVEKKRVVVYSSSPFDHPGIRDLLEYFIENEVDFSLPSIRWDTVKLDDLDIISKSTQKTLTLAPETMSSNLGCSIGKCFNFDVFSELVSKAFRERFNVKLYIMTGFPQESEEDFQETLRNLRKILALSHELGRKLTVNVNPLVPKPHTPLQDSPLLAEKEYSRRVKLLEAELGRSTVTHLRWLHAFAQSLVALGDRRIGRFFTLLAFRNISKRDMVDLANTLKVDISFPLKHRSRDERPWSRVVFPLDHIVDRIPSLGRS